MMLNLNSVRLINIKKIWDEAPHNAFTDLTHYHGKFFCVFRESEGHQDSIGKIRILSSKDGLEWISAACIESTLGDLRDPKLTITPKGQLMLNVGLSLYPNSEYSHKSLVWFSNNGADWGPEIQIGDPDVWIWRITWHKDKAYGIGYDCTQKWKFLRLYISDDGKHFKPHAPKFFQGSRPSESGLIFLNDGTALCLLRCEGKAHIRPDGQKISTNNHGQLGFSSPPYADWNWHAVSSRIASPQILHLENGRIISALRLYDYDRHTTYTSLAWVDQSTHTLTKCLKLSSGGDNGYPGLVWHNNFLWVSYYSSHEGKTSIYLAKIDLSSAS